MNDIELNKAIAEAAGWELVPLDGRVVAGHLVMTWKRPDGEKGFPLPDFANSYDAITPLVKALKKGREDRFAEELFFEVHPDDKMRNGYLHIAYCHALITATPRQLCQAYLAVGGADA